VAGRPSRTLDTWLEGVGGVRRNYHRGEGDVCVVEGAMGLYDGDRSSTAAVAEALSLPVVLVVDASASMESVAAEALGFREYAARAGHDVDVAGVLAARAHGGRHERGIREALPDGLAYVGRVPPLSGLAVPERHLGLHLGAESPVEESALEEAAETVDVDRLLEVAREPPRPETDPERPRTDAHVAVARDAAFAFCYPATLERLRQRTTVETFSPLAGDDLPEADGVYLPGGYPELHVETLASGPTLDAIERVAADGTPVLGECGGLMALAESLTTTEGETHAMAGVLPADVRLHERYRALDHVELRATAPTLTADAGTTLRGHEFHYSSVTPDSDARFAFEVERGTGIDGDHDGLTEYRTLGMYSHVHAACGAFDRFTETL
jgi:cobyrinic acid a,c-diamide synthase